MAEVAGHAGFCIDLRSDDPVTLDLVDAAPKAEIAMIETGRLGLRFDLCVQSRSCPERLWPVLTEWVARGAALRGERPRRMLSGGGARCGGLCHGLIDSVTVFIRDWGGQPLPRERYGKSDLTAAVEAITPVLIGDTA